jgi:hypothetical protein
VAEWQTRTVQVRVSVRTWGFKSPLAHPARSIEVPQQLRWKTSALTVAATS